MLLPTFERYGHTATHKLLCNSHTKISWGRERFDLCVVRFIVIMNVQYHNIENRVICVCEISQDRMLTGCISALLLQSATALSASHAVHVKLGLRTHAVALSMVRTAALSAGRGPRTPSRRGRTYKYKWEKRSSRTH